ncbi:MAG TPA: hypothetical protein PKA14_26005 [Leptospiraceae bacterium]|nr:hypothetical protein [Leptospiraceae bacterium]
MNILNQRKKSALLSILIYFFDSFLAFFKLINFFIYYLKSGQEIFINKFNKAMKGKMKLESKPHTLTAGRSYRMRHGPDRTDRRGFPSKKNLALKSGLWITKKMLPSKMQVV